MKNVLLALALLLGLGSGPALAQSITPSTRLSPNEETTYSDRLWQVPREPYQSRYRAEQEAQTPPPPADIHPGRADRRRFRPESPRHIGEEMSQQRFQSRMKWENEQRRISERSVPRPLTKK